MADPVAYRWRFKFKDGRAGYWSEPSYNLDAAKAMEKAPEYRLADGVSFEVEYLHVGPAPAGVATSDGGKKE